MSFPPIANEEEYAAMPGHHVVTAAGHTSAINVVPGRYWHHKYFSPPLPLMHFRDCCRLPPLHRQASCRCTLMSSSDGKWWLPVTRCSDLHCSGLAMNHTRSTHFAVVTCSIAVSALQPDVYISHSRRTSSPNVQILLWPNIMSRQLMLHKDK